MRNIHVANLLRGCQPRVAKHHHKEFRLDTLDSCRLRTTHRLPNSLSRQNAENGDGQTRVVDLVRGGNDLELVFRCPCADVAQNRHHDFLVVSDPVFDLVVAQAVDRVDGVQIPHEVKASALRADVRD